LLLSFINTQLRRAGLGAAATHLATSGMIVQPLHTCSSLPQFV
jgi:hypothetical protein